MVNGSPKNMKAMISLIMGIFSIIVSMVHIFGVLFAMIGVIFATIGLKEIKHTNEFGKGFAIIGLILSVVTLFLTIVMIVMYLLFSNPAEFHMIVD